MKAPLSWLKDYVEVNVDVKTLTEKLFSCGLEVEEVIDVGKDISGVVVGEVLSCEKIEGTHLSKCVVDCGKRGKFNICCGADNVAVGIKAPCALDGATVYATSKDHTTVMGVTTITKGKVRGIDSEGMLCSGTELGLDDDLYPGASVMGLLILPPEAENGADVKPLLGLDDVVFDIAVTANRPDCQSVLGIARETAAVLGKPLHMPDTSFTEEADCEPVKIRDEAPELCPRYIGRCVKNVAIGPSPAWMRRRLALCGIRSINNIVDITNFVLLEIGQPMHAFDLRTLEGREIVIRRAKMGEKITTLDEKEATLGPDNLVICDGKKPVALAGVMGGLNSEIEDDTSEVMFEAAKFARDNVRRTSRSLGKRTDSSALFEKGVSEYTVEMAQARALHLVQELGCGTVTRAVTDIKTAYSCTEEKKMTASVSNINALLGVEIDGDEMVRILERLMFKAERRGDILDISVPRFREDIDLEPDIAEEVIRFYGYDKIEGTFLPSASITNGGFNDEQKKRNDLKALLVGKGLYEVCTYSFYSEKDLDTLRFPENAPERRAVNIINPISKDLSVMRTTLAPSMLQVATRNIRRGNLSGRVFEIARVYIPKEYPLKTQPEERETIAVCEWGKCDFYDVKGVCEDIAKHLNIKFKYTPSEKSFLHPGKCATISCEGETVGYLGAVSFEIQKDLALDKDVYIAELDYEILKKLARPFKYVPLPKYPEVSRDLALVADRDTTCETVEEAIYAACERVSDVHLFDLFTGSQIARNKKSMAFTVTFTPLDEPIEDKIDGYVQDILGALKKLNVEIR